MSEIKGKKCSIRAVTPETESGAILIVFQRSLAKDHDHSFNFNDVDSKNIVILHILYLLRKIVNHILSILLYSFILNLNINFVLS